MIYQPVEKLLPKVLGNVYKLTTLAFRRAHELANGQPKLVDGPANEKLATTALREIIAGKVVSQEYVDSQAKIAKEEKAAKAKK